MMRRMLGRMMGSRPIHLSAIAALVASVASCREAGSTDVHSPPPDPSTARPPALVASSAASAAMGRNAADDDAGAAQGQIEPPTLRVVLDDPRLVNVRDRVAARDLAGAARLMHEARIAAKLGAEETCLWSYEAGRLALAAGALEAAESELDVAANASCTLAPYAKLRGAQAYLRGGAPGEAATRARAVPDDLALHDEAKLVLADALASQQDVASAVGLWRAALVDNPTTARWVEVALKLAGALLDGAAGAPQANAQEAFDLATRVVVEAPRIAESSGAKAARARGGALLRAQAPASHATDALSSSELARQSQAWLDAGDAKSAVAAADALLAALPKGSGKDDDIACKVALTRAHAMRGPGSAKPDAWGEAIARCTAAASPPSPSPSVAGAPAGPNAESLATALYFGAKASVAAARLAEAVERFGKVEQLFPTSKYADDARFHAALALRDMGDEARAFAMLTSLPDAYPEGDMRGEALFRVALARMIKGDVAAAKDLLDRAVAVDPRDHFWGTAGRAQYFRARVAQESGDVDDAKKRYAAVIADEPLAYYMAEAYARLASLSGDEARAAMTNAPSREPTSGTAFFTHDHPELRSLTFDRGARLLEVGDVEAARRELGGADMLGDSADPETVWTVASLFNQAGAPEIGHSFARAHLTEFLAHYPTGRWVFPWKVAFPRAFEPLVAKASADSHIPAPLTWAIMREESAFRADAKSHSNAIGLMQLLLGTARGVAHGTGLPTDEESLKRPEISIPLGAKLLGSLRKTYTTNPELAIAAYNSGSGSVRGWLQARGGADFDLFVEQIPFDETRNYIKRVLRSEIAYAWLYAPEVLDELLAIPVHVTASASSPAPSRQPSP